VPPLPSQLTPPPTTKPKLPTNLLKSSLYQGISKPHLVEFLIFMYVLVMGYVYMNQEMISMQFVLHFVMFGGCG